LSGLFRAAHPIVLFTPSLISPRLSLILYTGCFGLQPPSGCGLTCTALRKSLCWKQESLRFQPTHMADSNAIPNPDGFRVLAADSTAMSTQLLVEALARDSQFHMIESASSAAAILNLTRREKPHVVVISAKLGDDHLGGFELARDIRAQAPSPRVIMLLDSSERAAVIEAFRAGAQGVFCRTEPFRLLAKCIQCVQAGQVWASSREMQFVLEALTQPALAQFNGIGGSLLSAREIDVVRRVAEGLTNREIAQRLSLTEHTIKNYLFRIFDKLGVSSRVELVLYALAGGARTSGPDEPSRPAAISTKPAAPVELRKAVH
jgi:two-component system nitrate/nitrite response regulator NarL